MEKESEKLLLFGILPMAFFLLVFTLPSGGHIADMNCWRVWSHGLAEKGIANAYTVSSLNYPTLYLYILSFFDYLQGSPEAIDQNINFLKGINLIFDFLGIYLCIFFTKKFNISPLYSLIILFNIAYLYNTIVWGQVDSIHTNLTLASILFAFSGQTTLCIILLILAINMKLQSIIFIPLIFLVIAPILLNNKKIIFTTILAAIVMQSIMILPFIIQGNVKDWWHMMTNSVGYYPKVSMNAYNIWHLFIQNTNLMELSNEIKFAGVTYKMWGTLMFFTSSFLILLPVLGDSILRFVNKDSKFSQSSIKTILLSTAMITLAFFYFNTEMHERYVHSAIIFAGIYSILNKDYLIYILFSIAYFLNLEDVLMHLELDNYSTVIFDPRFSSSIFLICFFLGLYKLYLLNQSTFENILILIRSKTNNKSYKEKTLPTI